MLNPLPRKKTLLVIGLMAFASTFTAVGDDRMVEEPAHLPDSIFLGMNLFATVGEEQVPLITYKNRQHFVEIDGEIVALRPPVEFTFKKAIRHSDRFIEMFDFDSVAYSAEVAEELSLYSDAISQRNAQAAPIEELIGAQANMIGFGQGSPGGVTTQGVMAAQARLGANTSSRISDMRSTEQAMGDIMLNMGDKRSSENFDALVVSLKIRPDSDLEDCFLFARATYFNPRSDAPNEPIYNIQFVEIGDLKAGKVYPKRFQIGGFPPGPQVMNVSYHLYSNGKEIPSDYSEQRIELTESEAYDFLYADLFSDTQPDNAEPRLFKPIPFSSAPDLLTDDILANAYLKFDITGSGNLENLTIGGCPPEAKPELYAWLETLRFLPALEEGIPVDRAVTVPLSQIVIH